MSYEKADWDQRISRYLKLYGDPREKKGTQSLLCQNASELIEGNSVLDVGCGMGHLVPFIGDRAYVGLDISGEMLSKAHEYFPDKVFLYHDATNPDYPVEDPESYTARRFDTTITISLFIHLREQQQLLVLEQMWKRTDKAMIFSMETLGDSLEIRTDGTIMRNQSIEKILLTLKALGITDVKWSHQRLTYIQTIMIWPMQDQPLTTTKELVQRTTIFKAIR